MSDYTCRVKHLEESAKIMKKISWNKLEHAVRHKRRQTEEKLPLRTNKKAITASFTPEGKPIVKASLGEKMDEDLREAV